MFEDNVKNVLEGGGGEGTQLGFGVLINDPCPNYMDSLGVY